jgi:hypothetical protein
MKRLLAIFLAISMLLTFAACGDGEITNSDPASSEITSSDVTSSDETSSDETSSDEVSSTESEEPTSSTESTSSTEATHTHSWGIWKPETCALVNRVGTDKRTCSTCSATETRENTEYVVYYSFYDPGLEQIFYWGFNYDGSLRAYSLLEYAPYKYSKFVYKETSTDTIYNALAKVFVLDSSFKDKMRAEGKSNPYYLGYNEANDTFTFEGNNMGSVGNAEPLGYIHNGGKEYTVYYRFEESAFDDSPQIYKVVLEFNRTDCFNINNWSLNGEENKYLSFEEVSSVPDNLIR